MAKRQEDKKTSQLFKQSQSLASDKPSASKQLREVTVFLDSSKRKEVQAFRDEMPDTVKTFAKWKREAVWMTLDTSEIGESLTMAFEDLKQDSPEYTEEEVFEDFTSTETIDKIKKLESEIAHFKLIDAVTLAQDAARDFSWWEQLANDATTISTAATSCAGAGVALVKLLALANPAGAQVVAISTLSAVAFEFLLGWNRSARNKKGKLNLRDSALLVSDICESIRRDVQLLDEMGVYARNIAKCQEKVQKAGRVNKLQRDKIIKSAKKMKEACDRYMERNKVTDE